MSKFFFLTAAFVIGLSICSALVMGFEQLLPPDEPYKPFGIEPCYGHLCLHGIEPGKTRYSEAQWILKKTGLLNQKSLVRVEDMYFQNAHAIVPSIVVVNWTPDAPKVGNVVARYGWPCAATIQEQPDNNFDMWLEYPDFTVKVPLSLEPQFIRGGILDATSGIDETWVHNAEGSCEPRAARPDHDDTFTIPWLGFGSIQKYLDYYNANYTHLPTNTAN